LIALLVKREARKAFLMNNKKATMLTWEINFAIRLTLPGQLAKHAFGECAKAAIKFSSHV
jgi:hypothetical protein